MTPRLKYFSPLLFGAVVAFAAPAQADPDDTIKYRKQVMESIGSNMGALALITQGKVPHQGAFAKHAEILASSATLTADAFRENTAGKGKTKTTATADVWSKWPTFEKDIKAMEAETAELAKLASAGDIKAASAKLPAVMKTCKTCHDAFRSK